MACTSHCAAGVAHVAGMWLSHLEKCTCAELGQCPAGVCCLSEQGLLAALGLQAKQLLCQPGRQQRSPFIVLFVYLLSCPRVPFAEDGGIDTKGKSVTLRNGHVVISALLLLWIEQL